MNYLKWTVLILALCLTGAGVAGATEAKDIEGINPESLESKEDFDRAYETLKVRVEELKVRKKEAVTRAQKKQIRWEIKETKQLIKEIRERPVSGGIYIGSGALLLLLILLIIL